MRITRFFIPGTCARSVTQLSMASATPAQNVTGGGLSMEEACSMAAIRTRNSGWARHWIYPLAGHRVSPRETTFCLQTYFHHLGVYARPDLLEDISKNCAP